MQVLDLVFDDLRVAETRSIYCAHSLLYNVWMGWVALFKQCLLLHQEDAVVGVAVGHEEVHHVRTACFLQSARQLEEK